MSQPNLIGRRWSTPTQQIQAELEADRPGYGRQATRQSHSSNVKQAQTHDQRASEDHGGESQRVLV
jgi:hypothetical protein